MRSLQSELGRVFDMDAPAEQSLRKVRPPRVKLPASYGPKLHHEKAQVFEGKVKSHRMWAQHSVDMDNFYHGKRKAKRGDAREVNVGMALELAKHTTRQNFVRGKGLVRRKCKYSLYVEGLRRGYLQDINQALAWAKAASSHGLHGQCIEE